VHHRRERRWFFALAAIVTAGTLALALWLAGDIARAAPVSWSASTASTYDGVGLGGVTGCKGYRSPSWWRRNLTVAHKTLPCGTRIRFLYRGRKATASVWDRGPYVGGREFDLDFRLRYRLGFPYGVDTVKWRVLR
jgi:hypothetical protein